MGSHSVTCHPAVMTFSAFTSAEASTWFSDPRGMQGWVDLDGGYIQIQAVYPRNMVTCLRNNQTVSWLGIEPVIKVSSPDHQTSMNEFIWQCTDVCQLLNVDDTDSSNSSPSSAAAVSESSGRVRWRKEQTQWRQVNADIADRLLCVLWLLSFWQQWPLWEMRRCW